MALFRWNTASTEAEIEHTTERSSSDRLAQLEAAFITLSEAVGRVGADVRQHGTHIERLNRRDNEQKQWNAECQARVEKPSSGLACPGCGDPADAGLHGVFCFERQHD